MRKINLIVLLICLVACNKSTEDKIKSSLNKIELQRHSNVENIKIDSVNYSVGDLFGYYNDKASYEKDYIIDQERIRTTIFETLQASAVIDVSDEVMDKGASLIVKTSHEILQSREKYDYIISAAKNPDTSIKVYNVNYKLNCKTSNYNIERIEKEYLNKVTLEPIKINIDSIFKIAKSKKEEYDSLDEKKAITQFFNSIRQASLMETKLQFQIARGDNYNIILNSRIKIAEFRKQAAYYKVKYFWLFS